jgi:hypothetical protein
MANGNIRDYIRGNPDADHMRLLSEVASGAYSVSLAPCQWPVVIILGMEFLHENGIVHGDLCGVSPLSCQLFCPLTRYISRKTF